MTVLSTVTISISSSFQGEPYRIFSCRQNPSYWGSCLQGKAWEAEQSIQPAFLDSEYMYHLRKTAIQRKIEATYVTFLFYH